MILKIVNKVLQLLNFFCAGKRFYFIGFLCLFAMSQTQYIENFIIKIILWTLFTLLYSLMVMFKSYSSGYFNGQNDLKSTMSELLKLISDNEEGDE